jgi:hypothetical protein
MMWLYWIPLFAPEGGPEGGPVLIGAWPLDDPRDREKLEALAMGGLELPAGTCGWIDDEDDEGSDDE